MIDSLVYAMPQRRQRLTPYGWRMVKGKKHKSEKGDVEGVGGGGAVDT